MWTRLFFPLSGIVIALLVSGCATLPHETTGVVDQRRVEYALIKNGDSPAVVLFENGLNAEMQMWHKVIPEVTQKATVFAYNRPGYGKSDPVSTSRDGLHIVDELHSLLVATGLKPPYILVGHSFGGLYMQLFARRYPEEVAGLVLVDSTHPDHFRGKGAVEKWSAPLRTAFLWYLSPTAREEFDMVNVTGDEVLALPPFGEKPVIVLSALKPMREHSALADDANAKRRDLVNLYPGARQVWVESGHNIPEESPESVVDAIRSVLHPESAEH